MIRLLQTILVFAVLASPLMAQVDASTQDRKAELQGWFKSLSPLEQSKLRKRLKAVKRLPKKQQGEIAKAVKEGKPALSKQTVENLGQLGKLSYLKRARLHILMRELEMVKKTDRKGYDAALEETGAKRNKALLELVQGQRARWYMRSLPEDQRRELMAMPADKRSKKLRARYMRANMSHMDELSKRHPRLKELRIAARGGDQQAAKELYAVTADLRTLDMLVRKLTPERGEKVLEQIKNMDTEKAAGHVRRALNEQFRKMKKDKPFKDRREPRDEKRHADRPRGNRPGGRSNRGR
ncbi:hypothetical protein OAU50_00520 [Planctomycetota bacterium]|nr:hypothetical protein [Planctomycetota bacterium]